MLLNRENVVYVLQKNAKYTLQMHVESKLNLPQKHLKLSRCKVDDFFEKRQKNKKTESLKRLRFERFSAKKSVDFFI